MGLQIWLPLNGDAHNQGIMNVSPTVSGTGTWDNGKIGKCFNGAAVGYIQMNTSITLNTPFTFALWLKVNSFNAAWASVFKLKKSNNEYCGMCYSNTNTIGFHIYDDVNGTRTKIFDNYYLNASYVPIGKWVHTAIVYNGTNIKQYVNGTLVATGSLTSGMQLNDTYTTLGICNELNGAGKADCCINDFRFYDHALSPREVKEISKGLVIHYPLSMPGQENLLLNTATPVSWTTTYTNTDQWSTKDIYNMKSPVNQLFVANDTATFSFDWQFTPGSSGSIKGSFHLETGNVTPWILGSVLKSTGTRNNASNYIDLSTTNKSGHVTCTFIVSSSAATAADTFRYFRIRWDKTPTDGTLTLSNCKLERGEIATPWIPNSADAEYSALGFNDGIEYDVSGFGNNGTKVGTITYDADTPRYKTSAVFDGSSDIRSAKSSFGWFDFKEGTVAAWFKPANTTQTWASVGVQNDSGSGSRSFSICNYSGKAATVVGYDSSWGNLSSDYSMSANTWHHLCATITNGDTVKLYVNGELVQTRTVTNTTGTIASTTQFAVGVDLPGSDERFTGHLSDVRFYTTCLNESDVRELYNTSMSLSNNGVLFGYEFIE